MAIRVADLADVLAQLVDHHVQVTDAGPLNSGGADRAQSSGMLVPG